MLAAVASAAWGAGEGFEEVAARGRLALDTGRFEEAIALFERAAAIAPGRAEEIRGDAAWTYAEAAYRMMVLRDYAGADQALTKATRLDARLAPEVRDMWVSARMGNFWQETKRIRDKQTGRPGTRRCPTRSIR